MKKSILFLSILSLFAITVRAQQSPIISYQGVISDLGGKPADGGTYSITISFYSDESGTHPLWQDTFETAVQNGVFNIELGSRQPLPAASDMDRPIWVGTRIGNAAELRPLSKLGSVPKAINSITAQKLSTDYVSSILVNGTKVTGNGTPLNITTGNGLDAVFDPGSNSLLLSSANKRSIGGKGAEALTGGSAPLDHDWAVGGDNLTGLGLTPILGTKTGSTPSNWSMIVGQQHVFDFQFITGGSANIVGGAASNKITNTVLGGDFTGGGFGNTIRGTYGAIVAGDTNTIDTLVQFSAIAAGSNNEIVNESGFTIANFVGAGENNKTRRVGSSVTSGHYNIAGSDWSAVTAGAWNEALGIGSYVGAGANDTIRGTASAAVAGEFNEIDTNSRGSFIGTGYGNRVDNGSWSSGIVSGLDNTILSGEGFIGSGKLNLIDSLSLYSAISSGESNQVLSSSDHALIGSGYQNRIDANSHSSSIGGGESNTISSSSPFSAIEGGKNNNVASAYDLVGGGYQNIIANAGWAEYSSIVGGWKNTMGGSYSFIGGGGGNVIANDAQTSVIGGGSYNTISGLADVIGGGQWNTNKEFSSVIVGGDSNSLLRNSSLIYSSIVAGLGNTIEANFATIGGGSHNSIVAGNSTADFATLAGGRANRILSTGFVATIPGGDSLIAQSYAQTVVGYNNTATGGVTKGIPHDHVHSGAAVDAPLFIVGNGNDASTLNRSDAFEVSYDGHSKVYDINGSGSGPGRPAIQGAIYQDNVIYAWADVPAIGVGAFPQHLTLNADFGVASVWRTSNGTYVVTLNTSSDGVAPINLKQASITVTIENNDTAGIGSMFDGPVDSTKILTGTSSCAYATASQIGLLLTNPSSFIVHTYVRLPGDCTEQERPFFLKVTGR